ncbi:MarR family transcriptional regulator [Nibribacter ruber]|uniref:MarR family transcriptional regulator n=1 Tax=Nibribacter ruber TaxID=2698458 RepID=A0A6P1NYS2_9BACT|nr:MarR family transcriptional regulator [Nibribacter ruber]QHL86961.1 MarR family transcriptional regulator [Nibribacter ruber]
MQPSDRENAIKFLRQMSIVTQTLKGFMRQKFKAHNINITFEMLQVLRFLWEKESGNQQEIADAIIKDKASLTYLIDNLVGRNLVQRTEDSQDRRNKLITLTPAGKDLSAMIQPWLEEMYQMVALSGTSEELQSSLDVFKNIQENVKQQIA